MEVLTYRYKAIKQHEYNFTAKDEIKYQDCLVNLSINLQILDKESSVAVNCTIGLIDKSDNSPLLNYRTQHFFEISNFSQVIKFVDNKSKVMLPDNFILDIIALSANTVRGMLFVKNSGTSLSDIILPNFDYLDILNKLRKENVILGTS